MFATLIVAMLAAFPRGETTRYLAHVGDVWRQETLEAPMDFALYKSREEIEADKKAARLATLPYFKELPEAQAQITANRDSLLHHLDAIFETYESFGLNRSRGRLDEAREDSARYMYLMGNIWLKLSPQQWDRLLQDYAARIPGLASTTRETPTGERLDIELLRRTWEFCLQVLQLGVLDIPLDSIGADNLLVRNDQLQTERTVSKEKVFGLNEVYEAANTFFQGQYQDDAELVNISSAMVRAIFVPSLVYQRAETIRAIQQAEQGILPIRGKIAAGTVVVENGQTITEDIRQALISLERAQQEKSGTRFQSTRFLGQVVLTLATYLIFFLYLFLVRRPIYDDNRQILLLTILFIGVIASYALALRLPFIAMYAVPVATVSVLLTVMFDSRVGLFGTLTLAILGGLLQGLDFEFTFATLFAGTLGVFSVRDIKNRGQFFVSAGLVFLGYFLVLGSSWLIKSYQAPALLGTDLLMAGINSFLLIMAYPLLWIFERMFDITTDLTLLELSDTNRPLIKEMSLRTPGTFNHSLQVANLAEAAAASVGANALLARVGALYHDIGKMPKAEYFVENQRPGQNPHDQLKPRMSALIIASHVKEGMELGKQFKLPKRVLEFIPTHHGTSCIEYFYRKAQEASAEQEIPESEFRYPGPKPNSKETGILMLADSIEAASRSLKEPTHKRLESLIDMIVHSRIEDGQLSETDLTFKEIKSIKETFLSILLGIYHIRVKYPGQVDEESVTEGAEQKALLAPETTSNGDPKEVSPSAIPAVQESTKGSEEVEGPLSS